MKESVVRYPDRRNGFAYTAEKVVKFDTAAGRWVSSRVRIYTGKRKALRP